MDDFEKDQFSQGLGRLYEANEQLRARLEQLGARLDQLAARLDQTNAGLEHLRHASENLLHVAESHEGRLDKVEVQSVAILDDLRRAKDAIARVERRIEGAD